MAHEPTPEPHAPHEPSRRQVIAGAAGGAAALAASGVLAGAAGSAVLAGRGSAPHAPATAGAGDGDDVVVAHVVDASTGDIDVYVGESQVRIRDRAVASRLAAVRQ